MNRTHGEALSAFFDGEQVDADLLAESLAQPEAGALLAEFAAMRAEVLRDPSRPTSAFYEQMASVTRESPLRRLWGTRHVRHALAASLLVTAGHGGFLLGSERARQRAAAPQGGALAPTVASQVAVSQEPQGVGRAPTLDEQLRSRTAARDTGLPVASLRLRFANWRDLPTSALEEGRRQ